MTPRELNEWRVGRGYTQAMLAEALGIAPMTLSRYELGTLGIPTLLPLALKGLLFSHGQRCQCGQCLERYPRMGSGRDPRASSLR